MKLLKIGPVRGSLRLIRPLAVAAAVVAAVLVPVAGAQAVGTTAAALTLAAPATGTYGTAISLTGLLSKAGTATKISNGIVTLQRAPHGKATWKSQSSVHTTRTGVYKFPVTQLAGYDYRVYFAGTAVFKAAWSPVRYPVVTQAVGLSAIIPYNNHSGEFRASGQVTPVPPNGTPVYLDVFNGKAWAAIGTGKTSAGKVTVAGTRPVGTANYRLRVAGRAGFGAGVSAAKSYANYIWRGAFARPFTVTGGGNTSVVVDTTDPIRGWVTITSDQSANPDIMQDFHDCKQAVYQVQPLPGGTDRQGYWLGKRSGELIYSDFVKDQTPSPVMNVDLAGLTTLHQNYTAKAIRLKVQLIMLCLN
jgi:hypothetical protein